jgi:putative ABC transport system permease protein
MGILADLRFAARQLAIRPGFTALAILTLALGIGAAIAVFAVVDAVVLRPLPFADSGRLLSLAETHPSIEGFWVASVPNASDWAAASRHVPEIGQGRTRAFAMRAGDGAESVRGGIATPTLFSVLRARPAMGRLFAVDDIGPAAHVAIISDEFWKTRFGGDPTAVGREVDLDGEAHEIIGILPGGFAVPQLEAVQLWTPLPFNARDDTQRRWRGFVTIGRLAPDATIAAATAELGTVQQGLAERYPETNRGWGVGTRPLLESVVGSVKPTLLVFLGAVAILLMVACANVANLQVARGAQRERELAIRAAIGAPRATLVRLLAAESALLAAFGGALGLVVARWSADAMFTLIPSGLPRTDEVVFDTRVVSAALLLASIVGLATAVAPALRASRADLVGTLRGPHQPASWRSTLGVRGGLVMIEVALAVVLAVGAGLLGRSFTAYLRWEPGFQRSNLLTFWTFASSGEYRDAASVAALFGRLEEEIATLGGVDAVGRTSNGPLFGGLETGEFAVVGQTAAGPITARWYDVSPTYFATLSLPLLTGRGFSDADVAGAPSVAIVNETFAQRYLAGSAVGRQLAGPGGERTMQVIGVVRDISPFAPGAEPVPEVYWPQAQSARWATFFVVRSAQASAALLKAIEGRVHEVNPNMPLSNVATMNERIDRQLARPRFYALLIGSFAGVALTLTLIGVYGVMAASVMGRSREIGVRLALGASRQQVVGQVLRQGLSLTVGGLVIGLASAAGLSRLAASLVAGVSPTDLLTYATVATLVVIAATLAILVPAGRAAAIDPQIALRAD